MSTLYPAIKGKIGTNDYYVVEMTAKKAAELLTVPKDMEGWEDLAIEEQYQREINYSRVKKDMYPYLCSDEQRFFGSLIVAVDKLEADDFEPISDLVTKLPKAYTNESKHIGILTLRDDGVIFPIDGQHRLASLRFAISGKDENGKDLPGHKTNASNIAEDMVSLIMLPIDLKNKDDIKKARKIFTKLNKYARPTSTSQNLITNDDDSIAIISREIANKIINAGGKYDLVKWKSSSLSPKDPEFTTLDTVYKCNKTIIKEHAPPGTISDSIRQPELEENWLHECEEVWKTLLENIEVFKTLLAYKEKDDDSAEKRKEGRKAYLLGKPVPQQCLFEAYIEMTSKTPSADIQVLPPDQAISKLNKIPWKIGDPLWNNVLWLGDKETGRIMTRGKAMAVELILYMCGRTPDSKVEDLKDKYLSFFPEDDQATKSLPKKI